MFANLPCLAIRVHFPRAAVGVKPNRLRKQRLKYDRSLKPQANAMSLMRPSARASMSVESVFLTTGIEAG